MRKKVSQLILFMIVIMVSCFVTEMLLQSAPLYCYTCTTGEEEAQEACDLNCVGHGGCLYISCEPGNCICGWGDCYCDWVYECEDHTRGYTSSVYNDCPDC